MHVEVTIDKTKPLPGGMIEVFDVEFEKRRKQNYPGATFAGLAVMECR